MCVLLEFCTCEDNLQFERHFCRGGTFFKKRGVVRTVCKIRTLLKSEDSFPKGDILRKQQRFHKYIFLESENFLGNFCKMRTFLKSQKIFKKVRTFCEIATCLDELLFLFFS